MPTYEYRCPKCGHEFEEFQKITSKPEAPCPKCGATAERLLSAGAGLVFKGSGFYITDYKRAGEKKPADGGGKSESGGSSDAKAGDKPAKKPSKKDD